MRFGLVSCSGPKLEHAAPARELYCSQLFRAASEYAVATYDEWFILSAKYGLVHPDAVVAPYDLDLKRLSRAERLAWGRSVLTTLRAEVHGRIGTAQEVRRAHVEVYVHAGLVYRDALAFDSWGFASVPVHVPLQGLQIGQQLRWYAERRPHACPYRIEINRDETLCRCSTDEVRVCQYEI